jgi:hypothetical protein
MVTDCRTTCFGLQKLRRMVCRRLTQTNADRSLTEPTGPQSFLDEIAEGAIPINRPTLGVTGCINTWRRKDSLHG